MATRTFVFLLAYLVIAITMVSSTKEESIIQHYGHDGKAPSSAPAHAPVHAPTKAPIHTPVHAPKKAPIHTPVPAPTKAPIHAPVHAPNKAPIHTPVQAPTKAPAAHPPVKAATTPVPSKHDCVPLCEEYCKTHDSKRSCMRVCTPCCAKSSNNCVPIGNKKCIDWDHVMLHGAMINCP